MASLNFSGNIQWEIIRLYIYVSGIKMYSSMDLIVLTDNPSGPTAVLSLSFFIILRTSCVLIISLKAMSKDSFVLGSTK